jgi:L-arabinose isomerase
MKPKIPLHDFLSAYSRAGGTHHSALVYGEAAREMVWFGETMGWDIIKIG